MQKPIREMSETNITMPRSKIQAVSYHFPEKHLSSVDLEESISAEGGYPVKSGIIETITGIKYRHAADRDTYNSTLAAAACRKLFEERSIDPKSIDLLIFASAGQDIMEPATAHIVSNIIDTKCPVFDLTDACNSFLDALHVGDALIRCGTYKKILIATGEVTTKTIQRKIVDRNDFKECFTGYTFGDAGTAVLLTDAEDGAGIISSSFMADSALWDSAMFPGGGSRFPDTTGLRFHGNGEVLKQAFESIGPSFIDNFLTENETDIPSIRHVFVHQVTKPYLDDFVQNCGFTPEQIEETVSWCGNVAAASIPLQWSLRAEKKLLRSGDLVLMIGMAGGISIGVTLARV